MSFKSERVSRWASSLLSRGYSLDSIMWLIESHGGEAKVERNLEVGDWFQLARDLQVEPPSRRPEPPKPPPQELISRKSWLVW